MKKLIFIFSLSLVLMSFNQAEKTPKFDTVNLYAAEMNKSFTLINDTKDKVTIHTGSGIVSLNKGGKTSISCNIGKEVCWAENGKKKDVIFKISADHCGQTVKLSSVM